MNHRADVLRYCLPDYDIAESHDIATPPSISHKPTSGNVQNSPECHSAASGKRSKKRSCLSEA